MVNTTLEGRIMEDNPKLKKFKDRSFKEIPDEIWTHSHNYVHVWQETVDTMMKKYPHFVKDKYLDQPRYQKEFLEIMENQMKENASLQIYDRINGHRTPSERPPGWQDQYRDFKKRFQGDEKLMAGTEHYPMKEFLKRMIIEKGEKLNFNNYSEQMQRWESTVREKSLNEARGEYIQRENEGDTPEVILNELVDPSARQYIKKDIFEERGKLHAIDLLNRATEKRKALEPYFKKGKEINFNRMKLGVKDIADLDYFDSNKYQRHRKKLLSSEAADDYHMDKSA